MSVLAQFPEYLEFRTRTRERKGKPPSQFLIQVKERQHRADPAIRGRAG
jgi:hypothetical protein